MAFNPFRAFRKHQKAMFAALTILAMVVFVLTGSMTAGWDFFVGFMQLFGAGGKSTAVLSVYGKDYDNRQIQNLRRSRQVANQFMASASQQAAFRAVLLEEPGAVAGLRRSYPELAEQLQFVDGQFSSTTYGRVPSYVVRSLQYQGAIRRIMTNAKKPEGVTLLQQVLALRLAGARLEARMAGLRNGQTLYFGGATGMKTDDLADFLIWRHQADTQGIQFSDRDVQDLVNRETENLLSSTDFSGIEGGIAAEYGQFTRADFFSALGDEFRVRAAQDALGYAEVTNPDAGPPITPYQLWGYYNENRTHARVAVVAVPVSAPEFHTKLGKPTDAELRALYEKHTAEEYSPASPTAGFKQPPRIRVEWVRPHSEYFRQQARRMALVEAAAQRVTAGLRPGARVWEALLPQVIDARLAREYEETKYLQFRAPALTADRFALAYVPGTNRADNLAATIAMTASSGGAGVLAGLISYEAGGVARQGNEGMALLQDETRRRVAAGISLLLSGAGPSPLTPAATWVAAARQDQYLPLAVVQATLAERVETDLARKATGEAVDGLREELTTRSKLKTTDEALQFLAANRPPIVASVLGLAGVVATGSPGTVAAPLMAAPLAAANPLATARAREAAHFLAALTGPLPWDLASLAAVETYLPRALARQAVERAATGGAFERRSSQSPRDAYEIALDPGLRPLRDAYDLAQTTPDPTGRLFARQFFNDKAQPLQPSLYVPQELRGSEISGAQDTYLYWNTAEEPAYVPTFAEARQRVVHRWELDKARPAAEAAAKELARSAEKGGKPLQNLEDAAKRFGGRVFYLEDVARLVPAQLPAVTSMETVRQYKRYEIPEQQRENIEYPAPEMVNGLLKLREKGQVAVLSDLPQTSYFVATTPESALPPLVSIFYNDYANPAVRGQLMALMDRDTHYREHFRRELLDQLRAQAKVRINVPASDRQAPRGQPDPATPVEED